MADEYVKTENEQGTQTTIPVVNTETDGTGKWYILTTDTSGNLKVNLVASDAGAGVGGDGAILSVEQTVTIRASMQRQEFLLKHILAYLEVINGEKVDAPK